MVCDMSAYSPYVEATTAGGRLPGQVRAVRILLVLGSMFTALLVIGYLMVAGVTPESVGLMVWGGWPGVLAVVLARSLPKGGRRRYWLVIVVAAFWTLGALGDIGNGHPRGLTQLLLPVGILATHLQRASREFYRD